MVSCKAIIILLSILGISTVSIQARDISTFLSQMMREYVPKNTRQYTTVNGVSVDSGNGGSESAILSRISDSPTFGPLVKTVLANGPDTGAFLNSGPWTPSSAPASKPSSSLFSFFGRSLPSSDVPPKESRILTVDDLEPRSDEPQEFKIQSSMSFH